MPPRILIGERLARTPAGRELQINPLIRAARQGRIALRIVAGLYTVLLLIVMLRANTPQTQLLGMSYFALTALAWGLYLWSGSNPFAASLTGLIVYGTLVALSVTLVVMRWCSGTGGGTGIGIGPLDVIVLGLLLRSVMAGSAIRRIGRQTRDTSSPAFAAAAMSPALPTVA